MRSPHHTFRPVRCYLRLALDLRLKFQIILRRDQHGDVLPSGDQHDAAEAVELLMDGLGDQLRHWVASSLQHDLQTPSLLHLPAISQLPACTGKRKSFSAEACDEASHGVGQSPQLSARTIDVQDTRRPSCRQQHACSASGRSSHSCRLVARCVMSRRASAVAPLPSGSTHHSRC